MEGQALLATKQDLDYLQTQMKNVYATQAEHADRLARLEHRNEPDTRARTPWGTPSPFSGLLHGPSQPGTPYNPAAEAFKHFDQDQPGSLMGSLHLDAEDEPRRGASRANSVRFDESAMTGHFTHGSRGANDFLPSRTGSVFGSHPLGERSLSHKSDGRQSSTHSGRASSIGMDSRPLSATIPSFSTSALPSGPSPGLLILGPVPSIIRCWLDTNFSNDSLLYAGICTGSFKSLISRGLLERLGLLEQVKDHHDGYQFVRLSIFLAEATIQQASSRSASPAPQLPTITTELVVQDASSDVATLDIMLGCDVLRTRNADVHFSLDRLTMLDDERNKVSIPLVRPENAALFQDLRTVSVRALQRSDFLRASDHHSGEDYDAHSETREGEYTAAPRDAPEDQASTQAASSVRDTPSLASESRNTSVNGIDTTNGKTNAANSQPDRRIEDTAANGITPDTPSRPEAGSIWGSWRRDSQQSNRSDQTPANATSASGYQRASRGRGMKVLKPARLNTSRTPSSPQPVGFDALPSRTADGNQTSAVRPENSSPARSSERKTSATEVKPPLSSKPSSSNPIGGASAFGWLNTSHGHGGQRD